jgi:hypothetical protein
MIPLLGFTPDAPTTTPGILLDCSNFIPYEAGMEAAPTPSAYSDALAAECRGSDVLSKLDGSRRVFAGSSSNLYELSGTSWSSVSRAGGYTLSGDTQWSFAQFGDTSLAACSECVIQSSSVGAFANLTAPQAKVIVSALSSGGGFVLAFNTIDGTFGTSPDRWWCCALNDATTWTPSVATQATTGRLIGGDGAITAASSLGPDRVVAFKSNSLFVGAYTGPPTVWSWTEVKDFGCAGQNAVADIGTSLFVVDADDIYIFDGARPQSVNKLRSWFNQDCSGTYRFKTVVRYYSQKDTVWIWYVSAGSGTGALDSCIVYHLRSNQWGRANMAIEAALLFSQPTLTFDADTGTFDSATDTFDSASPGAKVLAVFNSSHVLAPLSGAPAASSLTLHDIGDDDAVTRFRHARLQYMTQPTSAVMSAFSSMATGGFVTAGAVQNAHDVPSNADNGFYLRQTARWHRFLLSFTGSPRISKYRVEIDAAGRR